MSTATALKSAPLAPSGESHPTRQTVVLSQTTPALPLTFPSHTLPGPQKKQNLWKALDISWDFSNHFTTAPSPYLFPNPAVSTVTYLPDPKLWSRAVAAALVEVLLGKRPASQLQRWVAPEIFTALERRVELNRRLEGDPPRSLPPKVLSSRICVVSASVVETTHSILTAVKTVAVCVRLEARRNQWVVTAVEML